MVLFAIYSYYFQYRIVQHSFSLYGSFSISYFNSFSILFVCFLSILFYPPYSLSLFFIFLLIFFIQSFLEPHFSKTYSFSSSSFCFHFLASTLQYSTISFSPSYSLHLRSFSFKLKFISLLIVCTSVPRHQFLVLCSLLLKLLV